MLTAVSVFYEITTTCMELMKTQVEKDVEKDMTEEEFLARLKHCKGNVIINH